MRPGDMQQTHAIDSHFEQSDIRIVNVLRISTFVLWVCFPQRLKIALDHLKSSGSPPTYSEGCP